MNQFYNKYEITHKSELENSFKNIISRKSCEYSRKKQTLLFFEQYRNEIRGPVYLLNTSPFGKDTIHEQSPFKTLIFVQGILV